MSGATDALDAGQAALARGAWDEARQVFQAAAEQDDAPAAWEGLSRAAWWQHDSDLTLVARERAYRGYQRAGDVEGAARLAMWLGSDHLDLKGDLAVASAWLRRARDLLADRPRSRDSAWVTLLEADVGLRAGGEPGAAATAANDALDIALELSDPTVEAVARAVLGTAMVEAGELVQGLEQLDAAAALALGEELDDPAAAGWALCHTVTGFAAVGELERAVSWCRALSAFCTTWSARNFFGVCRTAHGEVLATQGNWAAAEDELAGALGELPGPVPALAAARLGALRVRQGRADDARQLFESALPVPLAVVGLGQLALDAGDAGSAADAAERVLRSVSEDRLLLRLPALELLACAVCAEDDRRASAIVAEVAGAAAKVGTAYLAGRAHALRAHVALAAGRFDEARTAAEDALDNFAGAGASYDGAHARLLLSRALEGLGRADRAAAEATAAQAALERLSGPGERSELSPRETEILRLVSEGLSDAQVAERLVLSPHTVHRHMANVRSKLRQPSRAAAVAHATRAGLI